MSIFEQQCLLLTVASILMCWSVYFPLSSWWSGQFCMFVASPLRLWSIFIHEVCLYKSFVLCSLTVYDIGLSLLGCGLFSLAVSGRQPNALHIFICAYLKRLNKVRPIGCFKIAIHVQDWTSHRAVSRGSVQCRILQLAQGWDVFYWMMKWDYLSLLWWSLSMFGCIF